MMKMIDAKGLIGYFTDRFKTYGRLKSMLADIRKQEEYDTLVDELFVEIFDDQNLFDDWCRKNQLSEPVKKKYIDLSYYSNQVLEFFCEYKKLKYDRLEK